VSDFTMMIKEDAKMSYMIRLLMNLNLRV